MKVNVEVDCSPEEARRAVGLPDLSPIHDKYVQTILSAMDGSAMKPELLENMMKNWVPMGDASMAFWRGLCDSATGKTKD